MNDVPATTVAFAAARGAASRSAASPPRGGCATTAPALTESRWVEQINALGPSVAFEMSVPFPLEDDPRAEPAQHLRSARRRLLEDDTDGAILDARKALEWIRVHCGWTWPLYKDARLRAKDERWAAFRSVVEDQASGSVHADAVTSTFTYSRDEARAFVSGHFLFPAYGQLKRYSP